MRPADDGGPSGGDGALLVARRLGWEAGGRRIVGPLDLAVPAGERLVVVGPNGAGKTSLLRLLAGLLRPSAGEVLWRGEPLADLSRRELARRIAYVPQIRPARVPWTVERMVLLGRYPYVSRFQAGPGAEDLEAVARALAVVGIEHLRGRPIDELSGGERQSVYIASALAQEAELLVLDEPTTHLDPRHQREVAELLLRLPADTGRTVLVATHELDFASRVADRVLALADGRVLAAEPPATFFRRELLAELFATDFRILEAGERPLAVLEIAGS